MEAIFWEIFAICYMGGFSACFLIFAGFDVDKVGIAFSRATVWPIWLVAFLVRSVISGTKDAWKYLFWNNIKF